MGKFHIFYLPSITNRYMCFLHILKSERMETQMRLYLLSAMAVIMFACAPPDPGPDIPDIRVRPEVVEDKYLPK